MLEYVPRYDKENYYMRDLENNEIEFVVGGKLMEPKATSTDETADDTELSSSEELIEEETQTTEDSGSSKKPWWKRWLGL